MKKYDQSVKRWTRLIHGLLIRERLQKQYASRSGAEGTANANIEGAVNEPLEVTVNREPEKGGHLVGADDVVQRFTLPKDFQVSYPPSKPDFVASPEINDNIAPDQVNGESENTGYAFETMDIDDDDHHRPLTLASSSLPAAGPRTLDELAEASRPDSPISTPLPEQSHNPPEVKPGTVQDPGSTVNLAIAFRPNGRKYGAKKGVRLAAHVGSNRRDSGAQSEGSRKRRRGGKEESESDIASDGDEEEEDDIIDGGEDEDGDDGDFAMGSAIKPAPKRARKARVNASPAVPPSDRVLRVRKPPTKR